MKKGYRYKMTKKELVKKVGMKNEGAYSDTELTKLIDDTLECIKECLKNQDKVQLVGFGTFEVGERAAREGRNPQTGEKIMINACKVPKFRPGKAFKDILND